MQRSQSSINVPSSNTPHAIKHVQSSPDLNALISQPIMTDRLELTTSNATLLKPTAMKLAPPKASSLILFNSIELETLVSFQHLIHHIRKSHWLNLDRLIDFITDDIVQEEILKGLQIMQRAADKSTRRRPSMPSLHEFVGALMIEQHPKEIVCDTEVGHQCRDSAVAQLDATHSLLTHINLASSNSYPDFLFRQVSQKRTIFKNNLEKAKQEKGKQLLSSIIAMAIKKYKSLYSCQHSTGPMRQELMDGIKAELDTLLQKIDLISPVAGRRQYDNAIWQVHTLQIPHVRYSDRHAMAVGLPPHAFDDQTSMKRDIDSQYWRQLHADLSAPTPELQELIHQAQTLKIAILRLRPTHFTPEDALSLNLLLNNIDGTKWSEVLSVNPTNAIACRQIFEGLAHHLIGLLPLGYEDRHTAQARQLSIKIGSSDKPLTLLTEAFQYLWEIHDRIIKSIHVQNLQQAKTTCRSDAMAFQQREIKELGSRGTRQWLANLVNSRRAYGMDLDTLNSPEEMARLIGYNILDAIFDLDQVERLSKVETLAHDLPWMRTASHQALNDSRRACALTVLQGAAATMGFRLSSADNTRFEEHLDDVIGRKGFSLKIISRCTSDFVAECARRSGLKIPHDLSFIDRSISQIRSIIRQALHSMMQRGYIEPHIRRQLDQKTYQSAVEVGLQMRAIMSLNLEAHGELYYRNIQVERQRAVFHYLARPDAQALHGIPRHWIRVHKEMTDISRIMTLITICQATVGALTESLHFGSLINPAALSNAAINKFLSDNHLNQPGGRPWSEKVALLKDFVVAHLQSHGIEPRSEDMQQLERQLTAARKKSHPGIRLYRGSFTASLRRKAQGVYSRLDDPDSIPSCFQDRFSHMVETIERHFDFAGGGKRLSSIGKAMQKRSAPMRSGFSQPGMIF